MPFRPPAPFDDLCTVALNVEPAGDHRTTEIDWTRLPTEAGVVLLVDANARPVLIRGIGDPRAFVRRRLGADPDDDPTPRVDYRAVVRRVCVIPTGHTLLAELLAGACEALIDPELARSTNARLSACFVIADGSARLPMFRAVDWLDLWDGSDRPGAHETVLGPFTSAKRAKQWIEHVVDLFDLCRYDHLLAQTPDATACVYKQMGKCPAPCDGTEPLESYRERFRLALAFTGDAVARDREQTTQRMERAAADLDFETASSLKDRLQVLDGLTSAGDWDVCDTGATRWNITGPTRKSAWTRCSTLSPEGLALACDASGSPGDADSQRLPLGKRMSWLLLATLVDRWQKGLATGEQVVQDVREPSALPD